jgi:hypothetical protein
MKGQFKIYKKSGAAQFSLLDPQVNDKGFLSKEGAVLVELAKGAGTDSDGNIIVDWSKKISFAINMADICNLIDETKTSQKLVHNYKGSTKTLEFIPGKDKYEGTFMLSASEGENRATVPLTNGEYNMIMRLLVGVAAPRIIGWQN